jgi:hypothetical protein
MHVETRRSYCHNSDSLAVTSLQVDKFTNFVIIAYDRGCSLANGCGNGADLHNCGVAKSSVNNRFMVRRRQKHGGSLASELWSTGEA